MKKMVKVTGIMVMLAATCTFSLNAQRGMRGMSDSTRMNMPGREMGMRQMMPPQVKRDSVFLKQMHANFRGGMRGIGPVCGFGMHQGYRNDMRGMRGFQGDRNDRRGMRDFPGDRFGMRGMRDFSADRFGMRSAFDGRMRIESLLDLTEKQKTEIAVLRVKQQSEMKKLRDEFTAKMQAMGDDQRKKVTDLLTEDQKKKIESYETVKK